MIQAAKSFVFFFRPFSFLDRMKYMQGDLRKLDPALQAVLLFASYNAFGKYSNSVGAANGRLDFCEYGVPIT